MKKEIKLKISEFKQKFLQSYQKRKEFLIKTVFQALSVFIRILRNGMAQELRTIKEGTYKNSFFITNVFIGVFLWWFIYNILSLETKISLSFSTSIEFVFFTFMALIVDILINPFKEFRFLLRAAIVTYFAGYLISMTLAHSHNLNKAVEKNHKENILKLKDAK